MNLTRREFIAAVGVLVAAAQPMAAAPLLEKLTLFRADEGGYALYRIPKTVEKFAERYTISANQVEDVDFSRQLDLMERGCDKVARMIPGLRSGMSLGEFKQLNADIQKIESDADDVMLELLAQLYQPGFPKLKAVILKDLFELNEKVVDRCRDAGNVIVRVALRNS